MIRHFVNDCMPKGISFIPSSDNKRSHTSGGDIEYTEGAKLNSKESKPKPLPRVSEPRQESGFSSWLKRRREHQAKKDEVRLAATDPTLPEMTPGDTVTPGLSTNLISGEIYEDEEADRRRRADELRRLQQIRTKIPSQPAVVVEAAQPDPAPSAVHEGEVVGLGQAPDLLQALPFVAQHVVDPAPAGLHEPVAPQPPILTTAPVVVNSGPVLKTKPSESKKSKRERKHREKKSLKSKRPVKHAELPVPNRGVMHQAPEQTGESRSVDVNLIPHAVLEGLKSRNRIQDLLFVAAGAAVAVFIGFGLMKWYQGQLNVDIRDTEQQIAQVEARINSYDSLQASASDLQDELTGLDEVLNQHIYWTPFLEYLEASTLPTVYYRSMSGSAKTGSFTFNAVALDYSQIDPQARLLRESALVDGVNISAASQYTESRGPETTAELSPGSVAGSSSPEQTYVSFSMTVQFSPLLFRHERRSLDRQIETSL